MKKVKLGLRDIKPADLSAKIKEIIGKMTGNLHFPHPTPSLLELTAASEKLVACIVASNMGDRMKIAERRAQEEVVKNLLRRLASYIETTAQTEAEILSTGFELWRKPQPVTSLPRPAELEATRGTQQGVVQLRWKPVRNSRQYIVEMAHNNPGLYDASWQMIMYSSASKCVVPNLVPGVYYWFRVRALGANIMSPYSDPATVMAA